MMKVFTLKKLILILFFTALLVTESLYAQLDTNAPWPMFRQNVRHTGQTNKNVLGTQKNPVTKWTCQLGAFYYSSPAIDADGTIYIGSTDHRLYAVTNGAVKWFYSTTGGIYSSPAVGSDGTIYVGSCDNKLHAINADGTPKWDYATTGGIYSSPAVGTDGTVYVGSYDDKLYAITNGEIKWTNKLGGDIYHSSPAIGHDGTIYIGCYGDHKLYAITNGKIKWTNKLGSYIISSPAIGADNTVYIGCYDHKLYAITNGKIKWTNKFEDRVYHSSPAIGSDGTIYIGCTDDKLYAINADGSLKWTNRLGSDIYSSPAVGSDNTIYIGCYDHKLYAITNGSMKWSYTTGDDIYSSPAIGTDGIIYIGSYDKNLYAIKENHSPELLWSGNVGYINDGVKPNTNIGGTYFKFEIKYKDSDNDYPITNQIWIDIDDNDTYDESEKFTVYSNSGSSYSNGILYTNTKVIYYAGDGVINYKFYFKDKYDYIPLPSAPISNHTFTVTNISYTSTLGWTGELGFILDGINPNTNTGGTNFVFRVSYTNLNDIAPMINQVWIDKNDNGEYNISERFDMIEGDISDLDYTNGKIYTFTNLIVYNGDGILNYRFNFVDNIAYSTGKPTSNHIFRIIRTNIYYVKTNGNDSFPGTTWEWAWRTIQKAASTMSGGDITYISNGIYNETDITINNSSIKFYAYNPGEVIIDSGGTYCFDINIKGNIRFKGLTLKNAGSGIRLYGSDNCVISNCNFFDNDRGLYILGTVGNDAATHNTVLHCVFSNNTSNEGIFLGNRERDNTIKYNRIIHNKYGISWGGGWAVPYLRNTLYSNYISHNSSRGLNIYLANVGGVVNNNTINSNGSDGIYLQEVARTLYFSNNLIIGNSGSGVRFSGSFGTVNLGHKKFYYNIIANNGSYGVCAGIAGGWEDAYSLVFHKNTIYSNSSYGLYIGGDSDSTIRNTTITSNLVYGNGSTGIYFIPYDRDCKIKYNNIHHNLNGLYLSHTTNVVISSNCISSNSSSGICLALKNSFELIRNDIYSNQNHGIYITGQTPDSIIFGNNIYNNSTTGISCTSLTDIFIKHNYISSNPIGIFYDNSFLSIYLNNITNNNYGIVYKNGDFKNFSKNNLYPNNIYSFSNASGTPVQITNNWWGSTMASSIQSNIYGMTGYSNFTPYRLFGSFDTTISADTDTPDKIANLLSTVSEATVKLVWNKSTNGDFTRYSLYRSLIPGLTNFQRSDVITNIYNASITNYSDILGNGTWYYTITALDNKFQYTNESWYAKVTNTTVFLTTTISITKSISNISLNQIDSMAVPGSTITYKIGYSNIGSYPGDDIIIYDQIMPNLTFNTEGGGTGIGWSFEYSTNLNPDQSYDSTDYTQGNPVVKEDVKWIRWKKNFVTIDEDGYTLVFKVVIR